MLWGSLVVADVQQVCCGCSGSRSSARRACISSSEVSGTLPPPAEQTHPAPVMTLTMRGAATMLPADGMEGLSVLLPVSFAIAFAIAFAFSFCVARAIANLAKGAANREKLSGHWPAVQALAVSPPFRSCSSSSSFLLFFFSSFLLHVGGGKKPHTVAVLLLSPRSFPSSARTTRSSASVLIPCTLSSSDATACASGVSACVSRVGVRAHHLTPHRLLLRLSRVGAGAAAAGERGRGGQEVRSPRPRQPRSPRRLP
eukprot:3122306-Rhodomonas_salina.2